MVLAELEIFHSRPIAPTRRVALGRRNLPTDPAPGYGGVLLGGIVAAHVGGIEADLVPDLVKLTNELEAGRRISQPRLRHRLQVDHVGLQHSTHRLVGDDQHLRFDFAEVTGNPAQQVLGAVYAAGELPVATRRTVMATVRRGIGWTGAVGPELIATLAGFGRGRGMSARALGDPVAWALDVLGFVNGARAEAKAVGPSRSDVQRRFRNLLRDAHPDHGGDTTEASQRIAELTEARRILLG